MITIKKILKIKSVKIILQPLFPFFIRILWCSSYINKYTRKIFSNNNKKTVLFVAQNNVAANHLKPIFDLIQGHKDINFFMTNDRYPSIQFTEIELKNMLGMRYIHVLRALSKNWDLIVYVNHPWGFAVWFAPFIRKLYINHGIYAGKINNDEGQDGVYGRCRIIRPYQKPLYSTIFTSSQYEMEKAILFTPELKGKMVVTGNLRADLLIEQNKSRNEIRKNFGLDSSDYVIHIISTWGENSLFQTIGEELLNEAIKLLGAFRFILSIHPRHDEFGDIKNRKRLDILKKYNDAGMIINYNLDWEPYVIAADMVIADNTSLSLYYLILNKPIILTKISKKCYIKDSTFDLLQRIVPILKDPNDLDKIITRERSLPFSKDKQELSQLILDYRENAKNRHIEEIHKLLYTNY